ncbi:hypothetical protein Ancab_023398 [Ancistrocladus abbreviatus]
MTETEVNGTSLNPPQPVDFEPTNPTCADLLGASSTNKNLEGQSTKLKRKKKCVNKLTRTLRKILSKGANPYVEDETEGKSCKNTDDGGAVEFSEMSTMDSKIANTKKRNSRQVAILVNEEGGLMGIGSGILSGKEPSTNLKKTSGQSAGTNGDLQALWDVKFISLQNSSWGLRKGTMAL